MWRSSSRPPGEVAASGQWLGSLPRHSAGVGIPHSYCQVTRPTAILAHLIPSPSSHGSALARTGRKSLTHTKPKKTMVFHQRSAFRGFPPGPDQKDIRLPYTCVFSQQKKRMLLHLKQRHQLRPKHPDSGRRSMLRLTIYVAHIVVIWAGPDGSHTDPTQKPTHTPHWSHVGPTWDPSWSHLGCPTWVPDGATWQNPCGAHMGCPHGTHLGPTWACWLG